VTALLHDARSATAANYFCSNSPYRNLYCITVSRLPRSWTSTLPGFFFLFVGWLRDQYGPHPWQNTPVRSRTWQTSRRTLGPLGCLERRPNC